MKVPDSAFLAADTDPHLPELDLHGVYLISEALQELEQNLYWWSKHNVRCVRVIHGFGTGVLADAVHATLTNHPLIKAWQDAPSGGNCIVFL